MEIDPLNKTQTNISMKGRYRGCLLGGAVGDALGAAVEFSSLDEILSAYGPNGVTEMGTAYGRVGAITDDTQVTLFTADGLLRGYVRYMQRGIGPAYVGTVAHAYQRWLQTQDIQGTQHIELDGWLIEQRDLWARRAPGNTCLSALGKPDSCQEAATNDSKGCGGVMRVAPVALLFAQYMREPGPEWDRWAKNAFRLGCELAAITHGHPTGQLASGAFSSVLACLLGGLSLRESIEWMQAYLRTQREHSETSAAVEAAVRLYDARPGSREALPELGQGWIAEEALAISLYCALSAQTVRDGVVLSVNHSGDSDGTGSMTGNLLGAMYGAGAIPAEWLEPLELMEVIETVANDLHECRYWRVSQDMPFGLAPEPEIWSRLLERYGVH